MVAPVPAAMQMSRFWSLSRPEGEKTKPPFKRSPQTEGYISILCQRTLKVTLICSDSMGAADDATGM
jgi:hypothetical protein